MPATGLTQAARDAIVLQSVHEATPMLRRFAYRYHLGLEDLQQEAALVALESLNKSTLTGNYKAYIHRAIRYHTLSTITAKLAINVTSIDVPFFADTLAGPVKVADNYCRREQITRAIHEALHRLPTHEQRLLADQHQLNAFTPAEGIPMDKRANPDGIPRYHRQLAMRKLRRDKQLQAALFAERQAVSC